MEHCYVSLSTKMLNDRVSVDYVINDSCKPMLCNTNNAIDSTSIHP